MQRLRQADSTAILLLSAVVLLLLSACGTKKYLQPGQTFLDQNKIVFENKKDKKYNLNYELKTIYKQQPNEKLLFTPIRLRRWFHYKVSEPGDTSKFQNWLRRSVAEPPAIYDPALTEATAQTMAYYLHNKGFFDAQVSTEVTEKNHQTTVTYQIALNDQYKVDSVFYISKDPNVLRILKDARDESLLQAEAPVSESTFEQENTRIVRLLQNLGYAYFDKNYIAPIGDTTGNRVNIYYEVLPPKDLANHPTYTIGSITVDPKYDPIDGIVKVDSLIDSVYFSLNPNESFIRPQTILDAIEIRPGQQYRIDDVNSTNRQLSNMDIYRFIFIRSVIDSLNPDQLNFNIRLTPKKKMVLGADIEVNNSTYNSSTDAPVIIGSSVGLNYKNRNLFRNATILDADLSMGFEFDVANRQQLTFSRDIQTNFDFFIPKFKDFNGTLTLARKLNLFNQRFADYLRYTGKTRLTFNFNNLSIFDFYSYNSFNASLGYDIQPDPLNRFRINTIGVNFLLPTFSQRFENIRTQNPFLARSFDRQLFTGFLFRDVQYTHTSKPKFGRSWFFGTSFELSGMEILLANKLYNGITGSNKVFRMANLDFEQFLRLDAEFRYYQPFVGESTLASRIYTGIATSYGNSETVPYVKQFVSGGPNSLRAWKIRELGPGGYIDRLTINSGDSILFYQAADFKLELNTEWRFDIFDPMEGSLFLDMGNIWTLREDPDRPDAKLSRDFINQMAIGTGLGIRFDFNYFLIRFDFGVKLRKPYIDPDIPNDRYWVILTDERLARRNVNFNLAIGHAF